MKGVILETYGAGNGPDSRADLLELFRKARDRGVIVVNISQCLEAGMETKYAAGKVGKIYEQNILLCMFYNFI